MKRILRVTALACVLGGGAQLTRPAPAHATMATQIALGLLYCCQTLDHSKSCCYWTGCMVNSTGCFQIQ